MLELSSLESASKMSVREFQGNALGRKFGFLLVYGAKGTNRDLVFRRSSLHRMLGRRCSNARRRICGLWDGDGVLQALLVEN